MRTESRHELQQLVIGDRLALDILHWNGIDAMYEVTSNKCAW